MKKRILVAMGLMGAVLVVAAGVAWAATVNCQVGVPCVGTDEPDRLNGTDQPDEMNGKADDDVLLGSLGGDTMFGDDPEAADSSTDGDDKLRGNKGEDELSGFGGSDLLRGGGRADGITATENNSVGEAENPGEDTVIAGGGRDSIFSVDGFKDTIDCGANVDVVGFDAAFDVVADNCEDQIPF